MSLKDGVLRSRNAGNVVKFLDLANIMLMILHEIVVL